MDCRPSWLALGIPANRLFRICLAHSLAVVLSLLDSRLSATRARLAFDPDRATYPGDLRDCRPGEYWRRLALLHAHPTAFFRGCSAEMGDAKLRTECAAGCDRVSSCRAVASHFADWACGRRASGIFRKPFYVALRPISFPRRRIRGGNWRHGGSGGWNADRGNRGSHSAMDRQLYDSVFYCCVRLPDCIVVHPPAKP